MADTYVVNIYYCGHHSDDDLVWFGSPFAGERKVTGRPMPSKRSSFRPTVPMMYKFDTKAKPYSLKAPMADITPMQTDGQVMDNKPMVRERVKYDMKPIVKPYTSPAIESVSPGLVDELESWSKQNLKV